MVTADLTMMLKSIDSNLQLAYRLDGKPKNLWEFTGVVTEANPDDLEHYEYYEWEAVGLGDAMGIELHASSGRVHTHSVSYFIDQLEAREYIPAVYEERADSVRLATVLQ
jgi:hypothetical protein